MIELDPVSALHGVEHGRTVELGPKEREEARAH